MDPLPPIVINIFFSIKYFFENTFLCEKYIFLGKGKGRGKEFWSLDTPNFDFLFKIPLVFRNIMWWKRSNWIPSQSRVFWKILRPFHGFCDYPITMGPVPPHTHTLLTKSIGTMTHLWQNERNCFLSHPKMRIRICAYVSVYFVCWFSARFFWINVNGIYNF